MAEMKYVDLTADNLFDFCEVLDAIGVESIFNAFDRDDLAVLQEKNVAGADKASDGDAAGSKKMDVEAIGFQVAMKIAGVLVKNLPKARNEIYGFLAGCMVWDNGSKVTTGELKALKINQFIKLVIGLFKSEGIADFFKEVAEFASSAQSGLKSC